MSRDYYLMEFEFWPNNITIKIHRKNALYKNIRQLETKTPLFYIKRYRTYVQAYLQLQVFQFMKVNNSATDNVEIVSFKV